MNRYDIYNGYDRNKEIREAISAGERALSSLRAAQSSLNSASGWGILDMFGGNFITGLIKHSKVSDASRYVDAAKRDMTYFQNELRDIQDLQGLVWEHVFLPDYAPAEWQDRAKLWNAVEEAEKTKDSRLAREFVVALPIELGKLDWINLLSKFIYQQFVNEGMCADVAVHDTDGHTKRKKSKDLER